MPELVPLLDRLAEQVDRPAAGAFLTMAALRPFFHWPSETWEQSFDRYTVGSRSIRYVTDL
jgi:hypothetical protein